MFIRTRGEVAYCERIGHPEGAFVTHESEVCVTRFGGFDLKSRRADVRLTSRFQMVAD